MQNKSSFRYLIAYSAYSDQVQAKYERLFERQRSRGFNFEGFCVTPPSLNKRQWLPFHELDRHWKRKDRTLMGMYEALEDGLRLKDIFIVFNGALIHPDFLRNLSTFNVYMCWDDPESSDVLSRPVAPYFDYCFTGNASCVPLYQSWGVRNVEFLPILFFTEEDADEGITEREIIEGTRDIDIVFFGERRARRQAILESFQKAFPSAFIAGRGWPNGYLSESEKLGVYRRSKIGWNIHNSVGPCNIRTFALPANGILQICDNKCRLGQIFELGNEAIGFDQPEECIELTRYYLEHDSERRRIAAAGWRRVKTGYNEVANWKRMTDIVELRLRAFIRRRSGNVVEEIEPRDGLPPAQQRASMADTIVRTTAMRWIRKFANRLGYDLVRIHENGAALDVRDGDREWAYRENPEVGPVNWAEKENRVRGGGFLEWPNMVALNYAVASLVGSWKDIVEIGGGTGVFAYEVSADPARRVLCCESDEDALNYAKRHRWRANITYTSQDVASLIARFELVVGVDVIEHVQDFRKFLDICGRLAPNAIFTTPNKNRKDNSRMASGPPAYYQHVREWTAGEFYWVLRTFYEEVDLYSMPDPYVPSLTVVDVGSTLTPLIAVCRQCTSEYKAR